MLRLEKFARPPENTVLKDPEFENLCNNRVFQIAWQVYVEYVKKWANNNHFFGQVYGVFFFSEHCSNEHNFLNLKNIFVLLKSKFQIRVTAYISVIVMSVAIVFNRFFVKK